MYDEYDIAQKLPISLSNYHSEIDSDTIVDDKKSSKIEGYEQVFDIKIELRPVELNPIQKKVK